MLEPRDGPVPYFQKIPVPVPAISVFPDPVPVPGFRILPVPVPNILHKKSYITA